MDEVKKIEHGKILNTDTPDNSASNLGDAANLLI